MKLKINVNGLKKAKYKQKVKKLLSKANHKTLLGGSIMIYTLSFLPANYSGFNVCKPSTTKNCKPTCLGVAAGRNVMTQNQQAKFNRTEMFFKDRENFDALLIREVTNGVKLAAKTGKALAFRLNCYSDIPFENVKLAGTGKNVFELFPNVQFYDYTKRAERDYALRGKWNNYHMSFSFDGSNYDDVVHVMHHYPWVNIIIVISKDDDFPTEYFGRKTFDADKTDYRFQDPTGQVGVLRIKGANESELIAS